MEGFLRETEQLPGDYLSVAYHFNGRYWPIIAVIGSAAPSRGAIGRRPPAAGSRRDPLWRVRLKSAHR